MAERVRFLALLNASDEPFAAFCRQFGISRKTGYKWVERYEQAGPAGLHDRPPVARACPHRTPEPLVRALCELRKQHPSWGPKKLRARLEVLGQAALPAPSTLGSLLKANGLIRPRRRRAYPPPDRGLLAPVPRPNDTWCVDVKGHFALGDKTRCYPLTVTDHATRYLLGCEALATADERAVRPHFERLFRAFGLPARIRSDNGPPFATVGFGGLSALAVWWIKLGIVPERIEPGHPEQNGRHERMHRTLKAEATRPPEADASAQ
ncbi:MAG TPA: helix-turn-helix domain-containing protein [Polyangiaceae bacterium]|nr:helix-turn-helix domain-containing protein [Polyangiaceae bacterium]